VCELVEQRACGRAIVVEAGALLLVGSIRGARGSARRDARVRERGQRGTRRTRGRFEPRDPRRMTARFERARDRGLSGREVRERIGDVARIGSESAITAANTRRPAMASGYTSCGRGASAFAMSRMLG
jgi:hypothetical protein